MKQISVDELEKKIDQLLASKVEGENLPLVELLYRVITPISVEEAGELLELSPRQIQRYRKSGELHCSGLQWDPEGRNLYAKGFRRDDLLRFARRRGK
jgi:hypothetical protein